LKGWHQGGPSAVPGRADDGESALDALADVGQIRRLLDQAELVAVRTARRHGKSWAEIATRLGVTRQSAWERWRDLDDTDGVSTQGRASDDVVPDVTAASVVDRAARAVARSDEIERAAMERRRRSSMIVPNVVGMSWDDARHALLDAGLSLDPWIDSVLRRGDQLKVPFGKEDLGCRGPDRSCAERH